MDRVIKSLAFAVIGFLLGLSMFALSEAVATQSNSVAIVPVSIDQSAIALSERLKVVSKAIANGLDVEPVNCEALLDLIQAAQSVYTSNCPGP